MKRAPEMDYADRSEAERLKYWSGRIALAMRMQAEVEDDSFGTITPALRQKCLAVDPDFDRFLPALATELGFDVAARLGVGLPDYQAMAEGDDVEVLPEGAYPASKAITFIVYSYFVFTVLVVGAVLVTGTSEQRIGIGGIAGVFVATWLVGVWINRRIRGRYKAFQQRSGLVFRASRGYIPLFLYHPRLNGRYRGRLLVCYLRQTWMGAIVHGLRVTRTTLQVEGLQEGFDGRELLLRSHLLSGESPWTAEAQERIPELRLQSIRRLYALHQLSGDLIISRTSVAYAEQGALDSEQMLTRYRRAMDFVVDLRELYQSGTSAVGESEANAHPSRAASNA